MEILLFFVSSPKFSNKHIEMDFFQTTNIILNSFIEPHIYYDHGSIHIPLFLVLCISLSPSSSLSLYLLIAPSQPFFFCVSLSECDWSCNACRGPLRTDCLQCMEGHVLQNGVCVPTCSQGSYQDDERCLSKCLTR